MEIYMHILVTAHSTICGPTLFLYIDLPFRFSHVIIFNPSLGLYYLHLLHLGIALAVSFWCFSFVLFFNSNVLSSLIRLFKSRLYPSSIFNFALIMPLLSLSLLLFLCYDNKNVCYCCCFYESIKAHFFNKLCFPAVGKRGPSIRKSLTRWYLI